MLALHKRKTCLMHPGSTFASVLNCQSDEWFKWTPVSYGYWGVSHVTKQDFFSSNKTVILLVCYFYSMFNETGVCTYSYLGCNISCDHQNAELDSKFTQFLVTGIHRNVSNKTRTTTANQYLYQYSFMLVELGKKKLLKRNAWKVIKDFFVVRKTKQSHLVSIRIPVCKCSG